VFATCATLFFVPSVFTLVHRNDPQPPPKKSSLRRNDPNQPGSPAKEQGRDG